MDDDEPIDDSTIERVAAYLERQEQEIDSVMHALYGEIPNWIPNPSVERARRTIQKLLDDGLSEDSIGQRVTEAEKDALTFPAIVADTAAFAQSVYELAHIRYAISLGKLRGLRLLAGEQAEHGQRFKDGRKLGSGGPIRKAIAKLLVRNPAMKNPELWKAINESPPKGWQGYDNRFGKYLEGPTAANMGYRRFCTVCGQERKKSKG